ncbi:cytosine deaminase-like metal-dependent hydrolase [Leptolyngbyaceae cyanobacterium JSC-12]|nr:cytosine deaminase-like metal-dependent hydrolase [Leptolyngbyaceae cyanobacterium JSC-12]
MIPHSRHYWLRNAHVPEPLMVRSKQGRSKDWSASDSAASQDSLLLVDLEIADGAIASIAVAGTLITYSHPSIDLQGGMVFPCFVDLHTHLDKGHIWERHPNPDGIFTSALAAVNLDSEQYWTSEDVYRRMEFGLKCSYAHGTKAIRTHLDSAGKLADISFEVFKSLQQTWQDKLLLQAVCLVSLDYFLTPEGEKLADRVAEMGAILGGVAYANPDIKAQVERAFALAKDRNLDLDFHVDENNQADSMCLRHIAEATVRHRYQERVVCGHCCSLAVQSPDEIQATIKAVKQAKIGIVSLPLCNLYLQDRSPGRTPRWRGVTLLHELKQAGIPVAIASDNCRDPFYAYGDHDALEVFAWSTKIAHLDRPYSDWCRAITLTPADLMRLPTVGRIGVGLPADLVLFKARRYSELFSRSQHDRTVLRNGTAINTTLPDYAELDDLVKR